MSGEDDRAKTKPSKNPFFDESDAPPLPRARRMKPPPGIITAGGVDMARAHASGIQIREPGPEQKVDEPRVVLAVETDLRKVPTDKRLLEGRDANADGSRAAMLPGTPGHGATPMPSAAAGGWSQAAAGPSAPGAELPAAAAAPVSAPLPVAQPADRKIPVWMRVAMLLVGLLLVAGVLKRTGVILSDEPAAPAVTTFPAAPPPPPTPPPPSPPPSVETAVPVATAPAAPPPQTAVAPPEAPKAPPPPVEPAATAAPSHSAKPVQAPGPPKPTFKPPFELPSEK
jgi:hypothetical protein